MAPITYRRVTMILSLIFFFGQHQLANAAGTVDLGSVRQTIDGFGGSSAWLGELSDTAANTLFGNGTDQLGMTILRLRIDPGGESKWKEELSNAKKATAKGAKIMATPWTPPTSLKDNNNIAGGHLKPDKYEEYAKYLKSFVQYISSNGASVYAISVNNEPDIKVDYESCFWSPEQLVKFVKEQGGNVANNDTKLMASESFNFNRTMTDPILNDPASEKNVDIIAGHIYGGGLSNYTLANSTGKPVWMTEHYNEGLDLASALTTAKEILDCLANNFSAYLYWWLFQPSYAKQDTNGLIVQAGTATKRGYFAAQFAKFVRPGYQRVDATYNPGGNVYMVAFKNGSKVVIVCVNTGQESSQQIKISGGTVNSFNVYVTSSSLNVAEQSKVAVNGDSFTHNFPAQSATTFVSA